MSSFFKVSVALGLAVLASCKSREFTNAGEAVNTTASADSEQVNAKAFNAFDLWRDGRGSEILEYPAKYGNPDGNRVTVDGIFYVSLLDYWQNCQLEDCGDYKPKFPGSTRTRFKAVPTEGAKVVDDVLIYPVRHGKQLKIKFEKTPEKGKVHRDAVEDCKRRGLRLPTIRELFDFCAAGVTVANYGPNWSDSEYPEFGSRCGNKLIYWSVSKDEMSGSYGLMFYHGTVGLGQGLNNRFGRYRCVDSVAN